MGAGSRAYEPGGGEESIARDFFDVVSGEFSDWCHFLGAKFTAILVERTKKLGSGDEFGVILDASSE